MRHTFATVKALIIESITNNNVGTLIDIYKNQSTRWIAKNLWYDMGYSRLPAIPCSEEILRAFKHYTEIPVPILFDDLVERLPMYISVFGLDQIKSLLWKKNKQWFIDNGYLDVKFVEKLVDGDPRNILKEPEVFKIASDFGMIDDYLGIIDDDMCGIEIDSTIVRIMLEKCKDMDQEYMAFILVNDSFRPHMKIMFDRRIYPKLDDYIRFFDDLHTMMNCFDAYTLTELSKINIDRALWFPKVMMWRMVTIWPYHDILSSNRLMSLSDITVIID